MKLPERASAAPRAAAVSIRYRSPLPTRFHTRWRALKASLAPQDWRPCKIPPSHGIATERVEEALHEACRRMGLELVGEPVEGYFTRSRGAMVRAPDGALRWLKVNGVPKGPDYPMVKGEKSAATFRGIPKPEVLEIHECNEHGIHWCAFLMTLAPASSKPQPLFSGRRDMISDRWIGELKQALNAITAIPTERRRYEPDWIAAVVTVRFGARGTARGGRVADRARRSELGQSHRAGPLAARLGAVGPGSTRRRCRLADRVLEPRRGADSAAARGIHRRSRNTIRKGRLARGVRRSPGTCRGRPSRPALSLSDRIAGAPRARNRLKSRATKRTFLR
jgi:hypothetical protein